MFVATEDIKPPTIVDKKDYRLGYSYLLPINDEILNETKQISKYKLNAHYLSCSCKDYRNGTKLYPKRDLRRLCKHLYLSLLTDHISKIDSLTRLLIETNFWLGKQILFKARDVKNDFYFGVTIPVEKIYIFLRNSKWQRYEYNVKEEYWLNDFYPSNHDKLIVKIKKIISEKIKSYEGAKNC